MLHASEIYRIPPTGGPGDETKPNRPYLLLHDCPPGVRVATLAYGTTQTSLADGGCACVRIGRNAGAGLSEVTYFCLCRLLAVDTSVLKANLGRLSAGEMDGVRAALRSSLGVGRGTGRGAAAGSWRGAFVRLAPLPRAATGATFALVVTEPNYSRKRWYQQLVPLVDGRRTELPPGYLEIREPWLSTLDPAMQRGHLAIPLLFSGSEAGRPARPGHFTQLTSTVADEETMERVDAALVARFRLP